jgi:hypothetical protein
VLPIKGLAYWVHRAPPTTRSTQTAAAILLSREGPAIIVSHFSPLGPWCLENDTIPPGDLTLATKLTLVITSGLVGSQVSSRRLYYSAKSRGIAQSARLDLANGSMLVDLQMCCRRTPSGQNQHEIGYTYKRVR